LITTELPKPIMTVEKRTPKVDGYLRRAKTWQEEFEKLREIILECGLNEEMKWGCPCYTFSES
jgi:uncharacterized protein YdeI (YjbR/CyaY-like superfamily)